MALSNEKIEEIETSTWDLILEIYPEGHIVPPIDIMKIAKNLGIEVKFGNFSDAGVDGAFIRKNRIIYINTHTPYKRQVFTISHELGHYLLHDNKEQEKFYRRDTFQFDDDKTQEQEANWFAASLLMPNQLVHHYCKIFKTVQEIADVFMVSYSAAYWRLKHLGYIHD